MRRARSGGTIAHLAGAARSLFPPEVLDPPPPGRAEAEAALRRARGDASARGGDAAGQDVGSRTVP